MRKLRLSFPIPLSLCLILDSASLTLAQSTLPFLAAIPQDTSPWRFDSLFKRDGNCPSGHSSCAYMGAPSFCCKGSANCAVDNVGHAACCPQGAVCTGTIGGGAFVTGSGGTRASTGIVPATLVTNSYSIVPNAYYPFRAIPTTYVNAAACSQAWTGCQSDMSRCTAYLGGTAIGASASAGVLTGGAGVTISAPNIGAGGTVGAPTVTLPAATAASICSSLSSQACSGLQVTACTVFGNSNGNGAMGRACGPAYTAAVGGAAAVGIAGQMMWG